MESYRLETTPDGRVRVRERQMKDAEIPDAVRGAMWEPRYPELVPA
jgi:hypothetical protein